MVSLRSVLIESGISKFARQLDDLDVKPEAIKLALNAMAEAARQALLGAGVWVVEDFNVDEFI